MPLREKIKALCEKHQFREDLVLAVIKAESSFNPRAVSPKGAVGMMQLMRDTARLYGVSNRFNIDQNLEGGIQHLKFLYHKYRQDIPLTLAAYNAGEEAVERNNGIPPYTETRQYIRRIMSGLGLNFSLLFFPEPYANLQIHFSRGPGHPHRLPPLQNARTVGSHQLRA